MAWYGVEDADYIWHGEWADPELIYRGFNYSYWDVEEFMQDDFDEYLKSENIPVERDSQAYWDAYDEWINSVEVEEALNTISPYKVADWVFDDLSYVSMSYELVNTLDEWKENTNISEEVLDKWLTKAQSLEGASEQGYITEQESWDLFDELVAEIKSDLNNIELVYPVW